MDGDAGRPVHLLPDKDIVLLGVGHTHAHVVRMWSMHGTADTRLTCVSNAPIATYSGMLPGVLAGQYDRTAMEIDLVRLCAATGARLILGDVVGLDASANQLLFKDRPPVPYDVLSIGVGSVPSWDGVSVSDPSLVVPIKPMQSLLDRLEAHVATWLERRGDRTAANQRFRLVIVGAGAGGVEIAWCLPVWLRRRLGTDISVEVTVLAGDGRLLTGALQGTTSRVARALTTRRCSWRAGRVTRVNGSTLELESGESLEADMIVWATSAAPPPIIDRLGLPLNAHGFLATHDTLQTTADKPIFAVGDAGSMVRQPTPKAGVYAVRQGPVLWANLRHALTGRALERYEPQQSFLKLLNTGDGRAIGEWKGLSFEGSWAWRLKDSIDRRFIAKYQQLIEGAGAAVMGGASRESPSGSSASADMRCVGCGGKVAGSVLSRALARLDVPSSSHVALGLEAADDAAIVRAGGDGSAVVTVDAFVAPFDDPFSIGRISLLNAASDAFSMGATPWGALATVTLPVGSARQQEEMLYQLMAGALVELRAMRATLVGGHTIEGDALQVGFTILASPGPGAPRTKAGLRPGDHLVLTKALGTGVLLAAHMRGRCRAAWWTPLLDSMLQSNAGAAGLAADTGVTGMTDVTGFGFAGHLHEMLRASHVAARVDLRTLPLLPGAAELLAEGLESTLAPANRDAELHAQASSVEFRASPHYRALFDPQTGGGLLIGVPSSTSAELVRRLRSSGHGAAAVVGEVVPAQDARPSIRWTGESPS